MSTIQEKRVYADQETPSAVYVASEQGLVVARLSGDIVGEFSLARRGACRDVAAAGGALAVASEDGVLVAADGRAASLEATGFGEAVAVGILTASGDRNEEPPTATHVVAAEASGRVARLPLSAAGGSATTNGTATPGGRADDWEPVGTVEEPRGIDGGLLATADGVYRFEGETLTHSGLYDVNDVAAAGVPVAATGEALYDLGNGWMVARQGAHAVVDSDGRSAHAVTATGEVVGRVAGEWESVDLPTEDRVVGFCYPPGTVVAGTDSGSLLVDAGEGWRARALGVTGVEAIAVD